MSEQREHIVLEVHSDLEVPEELDRLELAVESESGERIATADLRDGGLPRTITLVHEGGPLGPVNVTARGLLGSAQRVEKSLALWFGTHERVRVELERTCLALECAAGRTCEDGMCADIPVTPVPDGGSPAPARDAGVDVTDATVLDGAADGQSDNRDGSQDALVEPSRDGASSPAEDARIDAPQDASTTTDASPSRDASVPSNPAGAPPVCIVERPVQNDMVQVLAQVRLRGSCVDPETGALTVGLEWSSNVDGLLASGSDTQGVLRTAGTHRIALCVSDPRDASVRGCASVEIIATSTPQPNAQITSVTQASSSAPPFMVGPPIVLTGSGTGASVLLSWTDSIQGTLGTGPVVTLSAPAVGAHTVTLTATDRDGNTARAMTTFVVLARARPSVPGP